LPDVFWTVRKTESRFSLLYRLKICWNSNHAVRSWGFRGYTFL